MKVKLILVLSLVLSQMFVGAVMAADEKPLSSKVLLKDNTSVVENANQTQSVNSLYSPGKVHFQVGVRDLSGVHRDTMEEMKQQSDYIKSKVEKEK
jgi:hypothetical protein